MPELLQWGERLFIYETEYDEGQHIYREVKGTITGFTAEEVDEDFSNIEPEGSQYFESDSDAIQALLCGASHFSWTLGIKETDDGERVEGMVMGEPDYVSEMVEDKPDHSFNEGEPIQ